MRSRIKFSVDALDTLNLYTSLVNLFLIYSYISTTLAFIARFFISLLFCFTRPKLNAPSDELVSIFLWNLVVQIRVYVSGICFMKV